jgi:hypothetical protein
MFIKHGSNLSSMPATKLARLEKEISNVNTEGVNIRLPKGTRLYNEIRRLLKKRHKVSDIKGIALL